MVPGVLQPTATLKTAQMPPGSNTVHGRDCSKLYSLLQLQSCKIICPVCAIFSGNNFKQINFNFHTNQLLTHGMIFQKC